MAFYSSNSQTNIKKQLIDQTAHFVVAAAFVLFIFLTMGEIDNSLFGLITGLFLGLLREITQHPDFKFSKWVFLDLLFWALGGAAVGYFI